MFDILFQPTVQETFDLTTIYDVLIIGGGPAGLNASLYAHRFGLKVGIITYDIGGQLLNTSDVDNYLGLPFESGEGLSSKFLNHVKNFEIPILEKVKVNSIKKEDNLFYMSLDSNHTVKAKTVLLTTGSHPKKLGIPGEDLLSSKGVSYCAICDAPFYKDKHVVVAGGGNSALESALDLAKWAKHVTIIQRSQFRADDILIKQIENEPKISYMLETNILKVHGDNSINGLTILDKKANKESFFETEGLFVSIGNIPNTSFLNGLVRTNDFGEVIVDSNQMTSVSGLYAAGDLTPTPHKQIIIAAADGAKAAIHINHYIKTESKEEK